MTKNPLKFIPYISHFRCSCDLIDFLVNKAWMDSMYTQKTTRVQHITCYRLLFIFKIDKVSQGQARKSKVITIRVVCVRISQSLYSVFKIWSHCSKFFSNEFFFIVTIYTCRINDKKCTPLRSYIFRPVTIWAWLNVYGKLG